MKYNQQFKEEAVSLALLSDKPYSQIAADLGVNYKTFTNWIRAAMRTKDESKRPAKQDYQSMERELRAALKELDLRKKEIEFLKKASAYFAANKR